MSGEGNPWLRFGLPLGSAIILVAFLDTGMNFLMAWMDLGGLVLYHVSNPNADIHWISVLWIIIVIVWVFGNLVLLWYGGIAKGNLAMLTAWIATTAVCSIIVLGVWIYALNLSWGVWSYFFGELYSLFTYLGINGYMIYVAIQCVQCMRENTPMEPIGQGFKHILKFYLDDPTSAARFLLISELVMIGEYAFTRQMMAFFFERDLSGHEGDRSAAIIMEEFVIRGLRFIISAVGLYFIVTGNLRPLKYWGLVYLGAILVSLCVFIYLLIMWNAEHVFYTIGYYLMFAASLVYRSGIMYTCTKVIQPYISSNSFLNLQENA